MKRFNKILALLTVCVLTLSACASKTDEPIKIAKTELKIDRSSGEIELTSDFETVAENDKFSLSLGTYDLNIALTDKSTGKTWYANHPDAENDAVALSDTMELLKAQLQIDYYDSNGNFGTMNSYTDCVSKGQYEIYPVENGMAVIYSLGDLARTVDDVPQKISNKRFTEKILNKLSAKEKKLLTEEYYNFYEAENMWAIDKKGRNNFKEILDLMDKAGYTDEDLAEDNRQYGLSVSSTSKIGFTVTVFYTLTDSGLSVSVPCEEIEYNNDYPPFDITLLPNFGAQRATEETKNGFLLIPDGSGALMKFDSELSYEYYYDAPVYGYDEIVTLRSNTGNIQDEAVSLPVFGISDGSNSLVAHITDGAANASITATRAGKNSEQYTVCPVFSAINMDYVTLNGSSTATNTTVFQRDIYSGCYTVEYITVNSGSYSDMAVALRNDLEEKGLISKSGSVKGDLPFYLETIGGAWGAKSFLGLSYSGVVSTTSYEQNIDIVKSLTEKGVENINLRLLGWTNEGMYSSECVADLELISALGGKKGFKSLQEYCNEQGIALYPDAGLIRGGLGCGQTGSNTARTLDSRTAYANLRVALSDDLPWYITNIYSPSRLLGLAETFLKSCEKLDIKTVSIGDNGSKIYSDYNDTLEHQFDRAETEKYVIRQTEAIAEKMDSIMVDTGNLYSLAYADHVVNVSTDNSWMLCEDASIPFVQLVLHGRVSMGSQPLNMQTDTAHEILRCAEYGVAPLYQLSYEETTVLSETCYSENFSACYADWVDNAAESWMALNKVLGKVQAADMVAHEQLADNVFRTEYDNGISVYVNYSEKDYTDGSLKVPAGSFVQKGED